MANHAYIFHWAWKTLGHKKTFFVYAVYPILPLSREMCDYYFNLSSELHI